MVATALLSVFAGAHQSFAQSSRMDAMAPNTAKPEDGTRKAGWIEGILRREMGAKGFAWGSPAHIRIYKEENVLEMWLGKGARYEKFKTYNICKWSGTIGPKLQEGDEQSPEGVYTITPAQLLSRTKNHRAVSLNFPNALDARLERSGSYLQIHGGCGSIGCYAMTDRGIEEIYRILDAAFTAGQQRIATHIFPFHLTDEKLAAKKSHDAFAFWSMLKPVYDSFQATRTLPGVRVCGTRYVAPGDTAERPATCVKPWQTPKSVVARTAGTGKSTKPGARRTARTPSIVVKCNLRLPSCRRWLANQRRKLARRGIRTASIQRAGASYVRKGGANRAGTGRVSRHPARDRRRRALRQ